MKARAVGVDKSCRRKQNFTSRWETVRINGPRIAGACSIVCVSVFLFERIDA